MPPSTAPTGIAPVIRISHKPPSRGLRPIVVLAIKGMVTIPIWPTYYALPIGCGLMAVVSLWKLFTLIAGKPSGFVGMESVKGTYND